jgi:HD superfamily phosphohydrolase
MIKCPVYRYIQTPPLCRAFMDTPEVQRLRNIKQLGFVHYVYPSAVHTRFEHSLGVMHMAGTVVDVLNRLDERATPPETPPVTPSVTPREKALVQLAGLMHDTGHMAFSHLMDEITASHHETRSVVVLAETNARLNLLSPGEEQMVAQMITGVDSQYRPKPYLYQIVANHHNGVDVDRMDYLARDAYHTGMPGFQPDYLIGCMRIHNGNLVLRRKAEPDLRLLFATRQRLFRTVYRHPTVATLEVVVKEILADLPIDAVPWQRVDDVWLTYHMRENPLHHQIDSRTWDRSAKVDRFKWCNLVDQDTIEAEIAKVVLI